MKVRPACYLKNQIINSWLRMMNKTPQIEASRLTLEAVRIEDAADIYAYVRNPNVLRYATRTSEGGNE